MNRELPKPLQDALARQTAGEVHPSPDLLTAFAEHNLPGRENKRVTDHLAKCADCREVVFLASSAVEEPVGEEQEWMPADAISRISPALRAKMTLPSMAGGGATHAQSRRRWMLRGAWVLAVAGVLVVSGILIQRRSEFTRSAPVTMAIKGAPSAATTQQSPPAAPIPESEAQFESQAKTPLAVPKSLAKSAQGQANQARAADTIKPLKIESNIPQESSSAGAVPPPASPLAPGSMDALLKAMPAVPVQMASRRVTRRPPPTLLQNRGRLI